MDYEKFMGFKLYDIIPYLEKNDVDYEVIEVWDNKKTKIGDDLRIINIKTNNKVDIYVAYF